MAPENGETDAIPAPEGVAQGKVDETTYKTVADAYYRKKIEAPTAARTNSQGAYTIAAAVAAALVTAGAFADLEAEPLGVRLVGAAALLAWLVTAGLFIRAVAAPYLRVKSEPDKVFTELAFVEAALANAGNERDTINERQSVATLAAGLASLFTVTVVALALFLPAPSTSRPASVSLSPSDRARLSLLCEQSVPTVAKGTLDPGSDEDGTIAFDPEESQCKTPGATTLQEEKTTYILSP